MQRAVRDVGFAHIRHRAERAEEIRQVWEEAERAGLPSGAALGRDLDQSPVRSLYGVGVATAGFAARRVAVQQHGHVVRLTVGRN